MPIYIEIVSISNCFQFISIRSYTTRKYFIVSSNCIVPLPLPSNLIIWDECPCKVKGGPSFVVSGGMMSFPVWSHVPSKGSGQWWMVAEPWGGGECFVCGQSKCQCCPLWENSNEKVENVKSVTASQYATALGESCLFFCCLCLQTTRHSVLP